MGSRAECGEQRRSKLEDGVTAERKQTRKREERLWNLQHRKCNFQASNLRSRKGGQNEVLRETMAKTPGISKKPQSQDGRD